MIEFLEVGKTANFYARKKRISQEAVRQLFRTVRDSVASPSNNLFRLNRQNAGGTFCSAICFSYERTPSFLDSASEITERVYGFLMIVEKSDYVAVVKSGLELPGSFKAEYLSKVAHERVDGAIAQHDAIFKRVRLKNMTKSKYALHTKSFEAPDLQNTVPTASANRYFTLGYQVQLPGSNYSATPNTGRISAQGQRAGHERLAAWAGEIIDRLNAAAQPTAAFLRHFARPIDLGDIPRGVIPTFVAFDTATLADLLVDAEAPMRLVAEGDGGVVVLNHDQILTVLGLLDADFPVRVIRRILVVQNPDGQPEIARLRIGTTRISLQKLSLPDIEGLLIESVGYAPGEDPERFPLSRFIDREDLFTILFSDMTLTYSDGGLFRDEALVRGGEPFLAHLLPEPRLANATSEKGEFWDGQEAFTEESVFRITSEHIAGDCNVLVCDDLTDEWADFIGLSTESNPPTVSFYHAKHGNPSLGASPFHDAVGQALKNLGRMALEPDTMPAKYASWRQPYRNGNAVTAIPRVMRSEADLEGDFAAVAAAPDHLKRVFIVTSSLSRAAV
ncbi:MAG TPA: hypothetical protein VFG14_17080, partial [Chthoniobacteraceae bacterium]|nr:hypothetical protein [Chthoniobacteraceae bacterium]